VLYDFVPLSFNVPLQATVSVSSRSFKKAVDRNRIKRQLREVYRQEKKPLMEQMAGKNLQLALFFIYTARQMPTYEELLQKMNKIILHLNTMEHPTKMPPNE
jgi:ribonuclease P protein component